MDAGTARELMAALMQASFEGSVCADSAVWFRDDAGYLHRVWLIEIDKDGDIELSVWQEED